MAVTTSSDKQPYRIFMCYRGNTAAIANMFRQTMEADAQNEYGNIWYSDLEGFGNFIKDIPRLIEQAEWIIFFVGNTFTGGFLDNDKETNANNVTAMEMVAIKKERQTREKDGKHLNMLSINIDGASFDETCAKDLRHLFRNAGILQEESVDTYKGLNHIPFQSRNDRYLPFIHSHIAPYCALGKTITPSQYTPSIDELLLELQKNIYLANRQCGLIEGYIAMGLQSCREDQISEAYYDELHKHVNQIRETFDTINGIISSVRVDFDAPTSHDGGTMKYAVSTEGVVAMKAEAITLRESLNISQSHAAQALCDSNHFLDRLGMASSGAKDALEKIIILLEQSSEPVKGISKEIEKLIDDYEEIIGCDRIGGN